MSNHMHKATFGLALIIGVGISGIASAQGMVGGGMYGGDHEGMMEEDCPMIGGQYGGMHGHHHGGDAMRGGMKSMQGGMGMLRGMQLDEEQQNQLRQLRSEFRQEHFNRMAQMMDLRDEMHALMASERPNPDEVQELHGQMTDLQGESLAARVRMRNQMQDLLTDDQRQQMQQYQERRGMHQGRSPGQGRAQQNDG